MGKLAFVFAAVFVLSVSAVAAGPDLVLADFEGTTYGPWQASGPAFGPGPAPGMLPRQMPVTGYKGRRLANSFYGGNASIGTLTSPAFKIERKYINFLLGGGKHPGRACINLLIDRRIVRTATGSNDRPGDTERLQWCTWDVSDFAGKEARIQIVDRATGGWGHISVDHIVQSDTQEQIDQSKDMILTRRYVNLPVKNGAPKRRVKLIVGDEVVREFEIELADTDADFWVFLDVTAFQGRNATLAVDHLPRFSRALRLIAQDDEIKGSEDLYREKHRPQFHFTSRRGWNNDSNGLVFHKGEYHLYYQHNPYGIKWGNMHWGHAVSKDLVHWTELPIAIYPHQFGDWVFSGSAVVDKDNTAGFRTGREDVIVAAYTSTGRGEAIAYSNDRGQTFTDYGGNPVVEHKGRDPKVIWYEPGGHWVMALYHETDGKRTIAFYTSSDLKNWEYRSLIDGFYECPEIFELAVDADAGKRKWVLYAADGEYMIGSFDGKAFTPDSGKHKFSHGNCFYASQTYNNIPAEDGRRIQIAWGRVEMPGMPFNQMMLFPVELTLRTTADGVRMFAEPVREIERLHEKQHNLKDMTLQPGENPLADVEGELFHIRAELRPAGAERTGLKIRGIAVTYDAKAAQLTCGDKTAPLAMRDGAVRLEILADRTSIEIFADDGRLYMPMGIIPPDDDRSLAVFCEAGPARIETLEVWKLRSAWRQAQAAPKTP
ncbi:MAG: GH32 C-terminal domain-containing protein [Sedimentisphaerales bacterium]|nr:GH32 C-terminal domain-containing protein [Sedimentisphaerales bacterium]